MKTFLTILGMMILCNLAAAQWVQTSGPSGGAITQFAVNTANGYIFALAGGDVYRSTDAGATWAPKTNALQANMGATVIAVTGTNVYIGLGSGNTPNILFRSSDNGDSWTIPTATGIPGFYYPGAMIVVGSKLLMYSTYLLGGGKMFASVDGGDNWTESGTGLPANFLVAYFTMNGSDIYAGSSIISTMKGVYKSTDNGVNWTVTGLASTNTVNGLTANGSGVFASTSLNGVHRTTDNGATWIKVNPSSATNFVTSVLATPTNLFIGLGGFMFKADQNGNSWDSARVGLPPANAGTGIYSMTASGTTIMCAFAKHGIYRTTDNGANWIQSHEGVKALKIDGIHASNGYLFAAGDQYGYFRSADRGDTWTEINNGVSVTAGWFCFARVGSDMLAGAGSSLLYRSSDNGDNWTLSNTGFTLTNSFAFFAEGNTVYTTGYAGVSKSTDGGLNWTSLPSGFTFAETGLDIWKDGSNVLAGTNGASHRSTDDGATWSAAAGAVGGYTQIDSTLFSVAAVGVKKSTDHGATWTATASLPFTVGGQSLTAKGEDLFVGTNDGVYRSTDKGASWIPINEGFGPKTLIYKITQDDQYLYAGTNNRSVWRRPLSEITSVKEISHEIPSSFSLSQNYPNPFNPTTNFELQIPASPAGGSNFGFVKLSVFDVLGREVTTLVSESLQPGTYTVSWDASGQPSGIYFYRLQSGEFNQTKPMMLIK